MGEPAVMLITGSRTGLGRRLAEHYAARGFQVVGCSRGACEAEIPGYEHVQLDVTDEPLVKELFVRLRRERGRLDVLINNAGVTSANPVLTTPFDAARRVLDTSVLGTFLFCREAAKLMTRQRRGVIVNLSSVHVPLATVGTSIYGAAKAAVEQFTRVLAKEVAPAGIAVHGLGLSFVKGTGMAARVSEAAASETLERLAHSAPHEFAEVAGVFDMLVRSPRIALTGETIYLGGV